MPGLAGAFFAFLLVAWELVALGLSVLELLGEEQVVMSFFDLVSIWSSWMGKGELPLIRSHLSLLVLRCFGFAHCVGFENGCF